MASKKEGGPTQTSDLAQVPMQMMTNSAIPPWLADKMKTVAGGPRGLENADKNDIVIPRLVLCQSKSPIVEAEKMKPGDVIDNITEMLLLPRGEKLLFIPVIMSKSRIMSKPITEGGTIVCRSDDSLKARAPNGRDQGGEATDNCGKCVNKEWDGENKPKCAAIINIVGLLPKYDYRPIVWSTSKTSLVTSKRLMSIASQVNVDFFALMFNLLTVKEEHATAGSYYNWDFEQVGYVNKDEYERGEKLYTTIKGKKWAVDDKDKMEADMEFPPKS